MVVIKTKQTPLFWGGYGLVQRVKADESMWHKWVKRTKYTFNGGNSLSKWFCLHSEKGSTLKGDVFLTST